MSMHYTAAPREHKRCVWCSAPLKFFRRFWSYCKPCGTYFHRAPEPPFHSVVTLDQAPFKKNSRYDHEPVR